MRTLYFLLISLIILVSCNPASPTVPPASPTAPPTSTPPPSPTPDLAQVLAQIKRGGRAGQPTPQDEEGRGIWPLRDQPDGRSEAVYPPFVLGPRRQTDQMVRQLYMLLPADLRRSTAVIITDRLMQNPEAYLPYLRSRPKVVIWGNFVGIGQATVDEPWFTRRHRQELEMGQWAIQMAQALGREVIAVRYTMGDSISPYSDTVRRRLQGQLDEMLTQQGLAALVAPISWGADEMAPLAMAALLPPLRVRVTLETDDCRHHWDGGKTTAEVLRSKLAEAGLIWVPDGSPFDFEVLVLTNVEGEDGIFPDVTRQRALDEQTLSPFLSYNQEQQSKLVIIDARMFNGSWDRLSALPVCDVLAYGGWGTLANKAGLTLAAAKILFYAQNPAARQQLYLEAVAHDVFANGYRHGRDMLIPRLAQQGIEFDHWGGYTLPEQVTTVFAALNQLVSAEMSAHFAAAGCMAGRTVRLTPQLWRTFESEAHLLPVQPGQVDVVGVYRRDLDPAVFDPTAGTGLRRFTLDDLVGDASR